MPPRRRIVSLLPSATEFVAAFGKLDQLIGRSHECDFPPEVQRLPICCRPRIDVTKSGGEIDRQVKDALRAGLSIYDVDTALLRELRPDVILTQTQCDVCAVTPQDLEAALTQGNNSPSIIDLRPHRLEQLFGDIHVVAIALHCPDRGHELVVELRGGFESLRLQTSKLRRHPTVACLEWLDPLMTAGNWVPELVEIAGGVSIGATTGQHSPWFDWSQLLNADPEFLVLMPCGWDIARARSESPVLTSDPRWSQLAAVRAGKVFVTDGHHFFNRPGPRLLQSAQILAEILHPDVCEYGHRGHAWERL
jgi:iron complex transport system substrate-binding protein